jgi:hypothetical protein
VGLVEGDAGGEGQAGDHLEQGHDRAESVRLAPAARASAARSRGRRSAPTTPMTSHSQRR